MQPLRILVLITGGRSDIQFLVSTDSGIRRAQADASDDEVFRELHEAILNDSIQWVIDPNDPPPELEPRFISFKMEPNEDLTASWQGNPVSFVCDEDANIILVAPKVSPAIGEILRHVKSGEWKIAGVLVFNTHREHKRGRRDTSNEPVATGKVLAVLASEMLALALVVPPNEFRPSCATPQATWFNYLEGNLPLIENGVLSEPMLDRIDKYLHKLASSGQFDAVVTVLDGGIPAIKEYISSVAQFRFGKVFEIHTPDVAGDKQKAPVPTTRIFASHTLPPAQSIRLRKTASELIRGQDFYGAHTIAKLASEDPRENPWVREVEAVYTILSGLTPATPRHAVLSSYMRPWIGHLPRCAVQALRVESALARGAIADAAIFTFSFAEAAQRDLLELRLRAILAFPNLRIDDLNRCIVFPGLKKDEHNEKVKAGYQHLSTIFPALVAAQASKDQCINVLGIKNKRLVYNSSSKLDNIWRDEVICNTHLDAFFNRLFPSAGSGNDRLVKLGTTHLPARDVRNVLSHSNLNSTELNKVQQEFCRLGIWLECQDDTLPGARFLLQAEVAEILGAGGLQNAATLYRGLIDGLLERIAQR